MLNNSELDTIRVFRVRDAKLGDELIVGIASDREPGSRFALVDAKDPSTFVRIPLGTELACQAGYLMLSFVHCGAVVHGITRVDYFTVTQRFSFWRGWTNELVIEWFDRNWKRVNVPLGHVSHGILIVANMPEWAR